MNRLWLSVSGTEDYHHFTDRYYSSVELAQEMDNRKSKYTFLLFKFMPLLHQLLGQNTSLSKLACI
jgi:hypothetical protein